MPIANRFFKMNATITAGDLAGHLGLSASGDQAITIEQTTSAEHCQPGALCFAGNADAVAELASINNAVIITTPALADQIPAQNSVIMSDTPRQTFAKAIGVLVEPARSKSEPDIAPTASIAPSAIVGNGAVIGARSSIGPGAVIDENVEIGERCSIGANVVITHSVIGNDVVVQAGAIIGEAGFGFDMTEAGPVMVPHIGSVKIGDGSHIGANTTIVRGSVEDTVIGNHVMIDNLVHLSHNCVIGDRAIIAAQVGIAGSTIIGKSVVMGGQVGVADHLNIGEGAILLAKSGVTKDVPAGSKIVGFPGENAGKYWRDQAKLRSLLRHSKTKE